MSLLHGLVVSSRPAENDISPLPVYLRMPISPFVYPSGGVRGRNPPEKGGPGGVGKLFNPKDYDLMVSLKEFPFVSSKLGIKNLRMYWSGTG